MAISAKDVMELRKQTDCGMMECKKALTQADGDFEKAIEILREQGLAAANKKAGRIAAEGMVYAVSFDNCAVVVEVNAETDFVAKNDKFVDFTKNLAKVVADENPADVEALMACKMGDGTVDDALKALILVIKENIKVRRFARYEGHCAAYVHGGGTHGVIVKFETSDDVAAKPEFAAFGKDIAMQVAAANPSYLNESDVPEDVLAKEKEIVLARDGQRSQDCQQARRYQREDGHRQAGQVLQGSLPGRSGLHQGRRHGRQEVRCRHREGSGRRHQDRFLHPLHQGRGPGEAQRGLRC